MGEHGLRDACAIQFPRQFSCSNDSPRCRIPPTGRLRWVELLTGVATLALGLIAFPHSVPRVDDGGLLHDETIFLQPGDVATGVGQGNFIDFVWVQPDFALAALEDGSGEALLELKRHCVRES